MSDPFDALKNADPGRDVGSPAEHWRIRERIIVDSVTDTNTTTHGGTPGRLRIIGAVASIAALVAGTVAVTGAFRGDDLPTIALGQGGANAALATEGAAMDAKMLWMGNYVFTLADGVDIAAGTGDAWRWPRPGRNDAATIARLVGATGTIERAPADWGGGWEIRADDGETRLLQVYLDGSWHWSDPTLSPWATVTSGCLRSEPSPDGAPDGDAAAGTEACVNIEPPASKNLPTDAQARAAARRFIESGTTAKISDVYRDQWSVTVAAEYTLDGSATGQFLHVTLGEDSELMSASGQWGRPEKVGAYPTISARDAVDRLLNGPYPYGPAVMSARGGDAAVTSDIAVDNGDAPAGDGPVIDDPATGGAPAMEEIEVKLVEVEMTHTTYYGADNVRWLLPSYTFTDAEGGTWTALAIEDKYLGTSPVDTTVPAPATPDPVEPPVEPLPTDSTVAKPEESDGNG